MSSAANAQPAVVQKLCTAAGKICGGGVIGSIQARFEDNGDADEALHLHRTWALTFSALHLKLLSSTAERAWQRTKLPVRSRLGDQSDRVTDWATKPEKTYDSARSVGVWNCESSDRIKGCDGARVHAVSFLAGAGG